MFTTEEKDNALSQFGQLPTPKAGSQLRKISANAEDHDGYFDMVKDRYVWFPFHDVSFLGRMTQQPMSFSVLYRGRTSWVQPVPYKAADNSSDAFDQVGEDDLPLKTFICTPFAQCMYLYSNYAEKGIRIFEHMKGESPELMAKLEEIILPDVPDDLISLGKYLVEQSSNNIEVADLPERTKNLAIQTLNSMIEGTNGAIAYCRKLIEESEGEILTRQNKGVGKAHLDGNDRYAYIMTRRQVPKESTLDDSPEKRTNELLERLVGAVTVARDGVKPSLIDDGTLEELARLKSELSEMKAQFGDLLKLAKENPGSGEPVADVGEVVGAKVPQPDLMKRLDNTKNKK